MSGTHPAAAPPRATLHQEKNFIVRWFSFFLQEREKKLYLGLSTIFLVIQNSISFSTQFTPNYYYYNITWKIIIIIIIIRASFWKDEKRFFFFVVRW